MIDNEKVLHEYLIFKQEASDSNTTKIKSYIGTYGKDGYALYPFYAGYAARDKEAEEEKLELIDALTFVLLHDKGNLCENCKDDCVRLIEKHTGKSIDEVIK